MIPNSSITDADRGTLLRKLQRTSLILSQWEENFLLNFVAATHFFWTDARRVSVDKMRMKYGCEPEIKMPFPLEKSTAPKHAEADADCCQFLVRMDGRQQPCNDPAAWQRHNGFRYCEMHADAVQRDLKRQGKTIHLNPFRK